MNTRFSRNPRIARVLTEMGWVRELNEGVKRIYSEMKEFFLDEPIYIVEGQSVKLILKNNIVMRRIRQEDHCINQIGPEIWEQLDDLEKEMLVFLSNHLRATKMDFVKQTGKSGRTISNRINHLLELGLIIRVGRQFDPTQHYEFSKSIFN